MSGRTLGGSSSSRLVEEDSHRDKLAAQAWLPPHKSCPCPFQRQRNRQACSMQNPPRHLRQAAPHLGPTSATVLPGGSMKLRSLIAQPPGWEKPTFWNSISPRQPAGSCRPCCAPVTAPPPASRGALSADDSRAAVASVEAVPSACCMVRMARLMAPAARATSPTVFVRLPSAKAKEKLHVQR